MINKTCPICNTEFQTKKNKVTYCSRRCSSETRRKSVTANCQGCNKEFSFIPWQRKNSKNLYCCIQCRDLNKRIDVNCFTCNKLINIYKSRYSYYQNFYCNNECRLSSTQNNFKLTDRIIENNSYQKLIRPIRNTARYLIWKKICLERDSFTCTKCNSQNQLTVHHIESMFTISQRLNFDRDKILQDIVFNNTNNGITVCRSCHLKEHTQGNLENEVSKD